jgi:hypothetical protein
MVFYTCTTISYLKNVAKRKTSMKMQPKPIFALASGAFLLLGVLCQTAQAQSVVLGQQYTGDLVNTGNSGPTDLFVGYKVTESADVYTYTYTIANPPAAITALSVDFATSGAQSGITGIITGAGSFYEFGGATGSTVTWDFSLASGAGQSATLSFESPYAPTLGNADATDNSYTWVATSSPAVGLDLAVPQPPSVPEPATTTLFGLGLVLLAFRPNIFKRA